MAYTVCIGPAKTEAVDRSTANLRRRPRNWFGGDMQAVVEWYNVGV